MSTGKALAVLLIAGAIALAAWQAGRTTERNAATRIGRTRPSATAPIRDIVPPAEQESEATFVVPILEATERPSPEPAPPLAVPFPPREDRPADSPARCITLQAYPSSVSAYGLGGEVVQLVVRAQNGCSANFGSASFRVAAVGPDGGEVASASGRFSGAIPAGGSAETKIAIPTKPSLRLTYRAEVLGY